MIANKNLGRWLVLFLCQKIMLPLFLINFIFFFHFINKTWELLHLKVIFYYSRLIH